MIHHSDQINELAAALAAAQTEMANASKNAVNTHFTSKYADLGEILNTVRQPLAKHGLSLVQMPAYEDGVVCVETLLMHASGQWLRGSCSAAVQKADPQGIGSATTYLRRYSAASICGIAQEDDDGNAAGVSAPARKAAPKQDRAARKPEAGAAPDAPATEDQIKKIRADMENPHITDDERAGFEARIAAGMTSAKADGFIRWIKGAVDARTKEAATELAHV